MTYPGHPRPGEAVFPRLPFKDTSYSSDHASGSSSNARQRSSSPIKRARASSPYRSSLPSSVPSPNKRPMSSLRPEVITIGSSPEPVEADNDENAAPEGELPDEQLGEQLGMEEDDEEVEEGIEGSEDEDEDEDDESEDEDEDVDDAASEDLEVEYVGMREGSGPPRDEPQVKAEPDEAGPSAPVTTLVAKKKRAKVTRLPSEERPPPPPLDTIRLEHVLIPRQTLEWDVLASAEAAGLIMRRFDAPRKQLASPVKLDETEEERMARELDEKYNEVPKKRIIKRKPIDYDDTDPFIDDSELQQDAPTHMARTVKQGFFVQDGPVEILEEEAKPATKPRPSIKKAPRSSQAPAPKQRKSLAQLVLDGEKKRQKMGNAKTPIKIDSDDESDPEAVSPYQRSPSPEYADPDLDAKFTDQVLSVDRGLFAAASKDHALLPPWQGFPNPVRAALAELRIQSLKYNWAPESKGKFPEELKPALANCGVAAIRHELFQVGPDADLKYFQALPSALPYNSFTLTKLSMKLCYQDYCEFLEACEKAGLEQFGALVRRDAEDWRRKFAAVLKQYEEDKQKWEETHPPGEPASSALTLPTATGMTVDSDQPDDAEDKPPATDEAPKEPTKRFLWTAEMREVFAQLLQNVQDNLDVNSKAADFRMPTVRTGKEWTENALRGALYKKIVDLFPEGYMTSALVSREMSKMKQRKKTIAGKQEKQEKV